MSSLWTPGGEVPVERERPSATDAAESGAPTGDALDEFLARLPEDQRAEAQQAFAAFSEEERAEAIERLNSMAETQQQMVAAPVAAHLATHALGLYELAALHLQQETPKLSEAQLAIDAMAAIVEGLAGRLEENEAELKSALTQIQLGFVQVTNALAGAPDA